MIPTDAAAAYIQWLERQPLAANTRRTYRVQVTHYCAYLATTPADRDDPLRDPHAASYAVRDYRSWLKTAHNAKPTSINLTLAALDHFYRFLGVDQPAVAREELPQVAPRALGATE